MLLRITSSLKISSASARCRVLRFLIFSFALLLSTPGYANQSVTLQQVVQEAILSNPEVQERWDALLAANYEQKRIKGAYYPRLDLRSRIGKEWFNTDAGSSGLNPAEASLELTQLLYDGFATRNEVKKFGHLRLARYYELLSVSEDIALETSRAYLDVLRYRELLALAEENYQLHAKIHMQVKERVDAGVGRGVDLEQATGRLALADSNRITEATNLHDVSARYLRLVGSIPPGDLSTEIPFSSALPEDMPHALQMAFTENPGFLATTENLRAAEADHQVRKAAYQPRLEFRARHEVGTDRSSITGQSDESVVELVMNYNLFRGGSDQATVSQFASLRNQARDRQIKTCRDIRQTLDIAFNDIERLEKQLVHLENHKKAIANAREAYRKQFDIGQRTLLDLLDTENEYFQARRAYSNASYDIKLAQIRTIAQTGQLLTRLGIRQKDFPQLGKLVSEIEAIDPDSVCPPIHILQPSLNSPESHMAVVLPDQLDLTAVTAAPEPLPNLILKKRIDIRFPTDQSKVPPTYLNDIKQMADFMKQYPETAIILGGHTDSTGTDSHNLDLSRDRAESVRNLLVNGHGIDPERVFISWYSSDKPIAEETSEEGRRLNRRTEAHISLVIENLASLKTKTRPGEPTSK